MDTEGTSTHASACQEADRCEFEIEDLRSRLAGKSSKTLDGIAALAVLAVYWESGSLEEFARVKSAFNMQPDMWARTISVSRD